MNKLITAIVGIFLFSSMVQAQTCWQNYNGLLKVETSPVGHLMPNYNYISGTFETPGPFATQGCLYDVSGIYNGGDRYEKVAYVHSEYNQKCVNFNMVCRVTEYFISCNYQTENGDYGFQLFPKVNCRE